jgi:hypothetical protein
MNSNLIYILLVQKMVKSNFTRPGVDAAVRLSKMVTQNSTVWSDILQNYEFCLEEKGSKVLMKLDEQCNQISKKWHAMDTPYCTFDDLVHIIEWKFKRGKPRPLWKLIRSNKNDTVMNASTSAFKKMNDDDVIGAIDDLLVLRGVGIAASSAILSLYRPDMVVFMDDEVIECLYDGKREYTMKVFNQINSKCQTFSDILGNNWNPRKVGLTLWTAARLSVSKSKTSKRDPTTVDAKAEDKGEHFSKEEQALIKRRRTSKMD